MLDKLSLLSEATKETPTGRKHTAEPGGYGRKFDTDEEGEEKKDDKKEPAAKRGRGRPKKGADDSGEVKKYDNAKKMQDFMIGNKPKKSKELDKLPSKKHTLKDWFEAMDKKMLEEAAPGQSLAVKPLPGASQLVDPASNKVVATGPADKIKALQGSVAKGEVTMTGREDMAEEGDGKWIKKAIKHPGAFTKKAKSHGMSTSAFAKKVLANKDDYPAKTEKQAQLAKTLGKMNEADIPSDQVDMGAGLGAGRSQTTLEAKKAKEDPKAMKKDHKAEKEGKKVTKDMEKVDEAAKPDYIDLDKDGNKKETMKKAAKDAKSDKKKVNESMHKHTAARLLGKSHALAKEGYNCRYEDVEEARCYHDGFKEGLDECYGMMPVQGLVGETGVPGAPATPPATTGGMASQAAAQPAMEADMEEGNAFTAALAKTDKGDKFSVGGKTFTDRSDYSAKIDEFAFESLDNQLSALLTESEEVTEGMSVSISKGQQGMPDTVSVSAQDGEAEQLLSFIKQAGLGLFGDGGPASNYGAPEGDSSVDHGGIKVVGDHDGMMGLMKKIAGMEQGSEVQDYESEEGHDDEHDHGHDDTCEACGQADCECDESQEMVDEVETDDQRLEQVAETDIEKLRELAGMSQKQEVAEANPPDSDAAETTADENAEAEEDKALAMKSMNEGSENLTEWANDAGQTIEEFREETFEADIDFMMNVISSGLNKKKSTGQQTVPVLAGDEARTNIKEGADPLAEWKALSGIK